MLVGFGGTILTSRKNTTHLAKPMGFYDAKTIPDRLIVGYQSKDYDAQKEAEEHTINNLVKASTSFFYHSGDYPDFKNKLYNQRTLNNLLE